MNRLFLAATGWLCLCPALVAQAPNLNAPFPMGARIGDTLDLKLTGQNLQEPLRLHASFPVEASFPAENKNGTEPTSLVVRLKVPGDAPLGWHWLRLETRRGLSNLRLFCLDELPQRLKEGAPNSPETAQAIPIPCVLCGTLQREKTDYFRLKVEAGQRLCIDVLGRRLGSPLDPQVALLDPKTQRQVAFSDDSPGQQKDPRLVHVFRSGGEVLLELRDVRYQGGGDWHYRVRLGDFPIASAPVPMAVQRGVTTEVGFAGPWVESSEGIAARVDDPALVALSVWPRGRPSFPSRPLGLPGWPVQLRVSDHPELMESPASASTKDAQSIPVPGAVSGRLSKPGEKDHYRVELKKGERVVLEAETHAAGVATNVYFILNDSAGKQLAASNPSVEPARIDFTAPVDGSYLIQIEHLHYNAGPDEAYRLVLRRYQPDFRLTTNVDRLNLSPGSAGLLLVSAQRQDYNGPIQLSVVRPEGVTGQATLAEGQTTGLLLLRVDPAAKPSTLSLRVEGTATINGVAVRQPVLMEPALKGSLANLRYPPAELGRQLALGLLPALPFQVKATPVYPEAVRGLPVPVMVSLTSISGLQGEPQVTAQTVPPLPNQPPMVAPIKAKIPAGKTELRTELKPTPQAPEGLVVYFSVAGKVNGVELSDTVPLPPLKFVPPVELSVEAPPAAKLPGAEPPLLGLALDAITNGPRLAAALELASRPTKPTPVPLKITAKRKGGYQGPVQFEFKNLPAGVRVGPSGLAEGQSEATVSLLLGPAAPGQTGEATVEGIATAAGNQRSLPAKFSLKLTR